MEVSEIQKMIANRKRSGSAPMDNETFGRVVVGLIMGKTYKDIAENAKVTSNTAMKVCKKVKENDKNTISRITELEIDKNIEALKKKLYPEG
jgi:hypothetical protein